MQWFTELQNNKTTEVLNDAAKVATNYSLRLWEKQVEVTRSFADRSVSHALGAQDLKTPEDAMQLQRNASESELAEWQRTVNEFSQLAKDAGDEFSAITDKGLDVWGKSLQEASEKSPFLFPYGAKADAYINSVNSFYQMAKNSGGIFRNNIQGFGHAAQKNAEAAVQNSKSAKSSKANGKSAKR